MAGALEAGVSAQAIVGRAAESIDAVRDVAQRAEVGFEPIVEVGPPYTRRKE